MMLRLAASFWKTVCAVFLPLMRVWKRVMGFPWCPVRLVFWKLIVWISSAGRVLFRAVWTLSVSSVACANVLMSM